MPDGDFFGERVEDVHRFLEPDLRDPEGVPHVVLNPRGKAQEGALGRPISAMSNHEGRATEAL